MDKKYPECEKLDKVSKESNAIREFFDWLGEELNFVLFKWHDAGDNGEAKFIDSDGKPAFNVHSQFSFEDNPKSDTLNPNYETHQEGYYRVCTPFEKLLAQYFDIDMNKVEQERRQMLDECRKLNNDSN